MKTLLRMLLAIVLLSMTGLTQAYEVGTHEELSAVAVDASVLNQVGVLTNLGLRPLVGAQEFPDSQGNPRTVVQLFRHGANFEDSLTLTNLRPLNHFFDPLTGRPLTVGGVALGHPSPDWALEDAGEITGTLGFGRQDFSYRDAREFFYRSLTGRDTQGAVVAATQAERDRNFGLTFQTLGHVIHHIQDMAQPQHVRNDVHLPVPIIGSPSLYEIYTNFNRGQAFFTRHLVPGIYPQVAFDTPRSFWRTGTGDGQGIAEFSNRNFVSAGTNFDNPVYPRPFFSLATQHDENANALLAEAGAAIPPECLPPNTPCVMTFYRNPVDDTYRTTLNATNDRTSTWSIFDQDLTVNNLDPAFSLNRFNFDAAHAFLIPRAVGYSAGLIDYFFRGKIDFAADPATPGAVLIKNLGNEPMTGTFTLYYDAVDGNRYPVAGASATETWTNISIAASDINGPGISGPLTFTGPTAPAPRAQGRYMLVFRGALGQELDAVVGKLVKPYVIVGRSVGGAFRWTEAGGMLLIGGADSSATGVSADGSVVVGAIYTSGGVGPFYAFRWSQAGGMQLVGGDGSEATGVSADGSVVVGAISTRGGDPNIPYVSPYYAFRWTQAGGMQLIGGANSWAYGVSADGSVVVGATFTVDGPPYSAFRWTQVGGMQIIGADHSWASGVSADGSVVVGGISAGAGEINRAFRWTQAGGMQIIGGDTSDAYGVSADGSVVVGRMSVGNGDYAFRWTQASGMQPIGGADGTAYGVSGDGSVLVGGVEDSDDHAFRWTQTDGMVILGLGTAYGVSDGSYGE